MSVDGRERRYRVFLPSQADGSRPLPLVLVLHGSGDSGAVIESFSGYNDEAARRGFLVAYPDGVYAWNSRFPAAATDSSGPLDDVRFLVDLVDEIARIHPVDRTRVYATGHSSGGRMSYRLGCERPDVFAAVAPVAGGLQILCRPSRPIAVFHVQGEADPQTFRESEASVPMMLRTNGCLARPTVSRSGKAEVRRYAPCRGGTEFTYVAIPGWGHDWPRNLVFDTAGESWKFLSRYTLP